MGFFLFLSCFSCRFFFSKIRSFDLTRSEEKGTGSVVGWAVSIVLFSQVSLTTTDNNTRLTNEIFSGPFSKRQLGAPIVRDLSHKKATKKMIADGETNHWRSHSRGSLIIYTKMKKKRKTLIKKFKKEVSCLLLVLALSKIHQISFVTHDLS